MDIDVPSGRLIGGRCVEVFTSWLSVRKTHACAFQFSITDTAHYRFLQAMSPFLLFSICATYRTLPLLEGICLLLF